MLEQELHFAARHWILMLLRSTKLQRAFVKDSGFGDPDVAEFLDMLHFEDETPFDRAKVLKHLHAEIEKCRDVPSEAIPASVRTNLKTLSRILKLSNLECRLLFLMCLREWFPVCRDAAELVKAKSRKQTIDILAEALGVLPRQLNRIVGPGSALVTGGLLNWEQSRPFRGLQLARETICEAIFSDNLKPGALLKGIVNIAPPPTLSMRDFKHLGAIVSDVRKHLHKVLKNRSCGCNILFYGPPGSGKSELSRVLARSLRKQLLEIPFQDEDGDPVSAYRRIEFLRGALQLLNGRSALYVFDECEDVFRGEGLLTHGYAQQRKAWMNRMLESNSGPIMWITNSHSCMDEAFLRRFDIVLEIPHPSERCRRQILKSLCRDSLNQAMIEQCAQTKSLSVATVAKVNAVTSQLYPTGSQRDESFSRIVDGFLKAQGTTDTRIRPKKSMTADVFDPKYLNADPPLEKLLESFNAEMELRCLLHGMPGTGKTAFGRWLSSVLDMPLHIKRASDLQSPFLGMTECYLARAFREAEAERAILMIDEIDTFLQDRSYAQRSWEVSQVNEFLTCMETFEGVFLCSTNRIDTLDPACVRRFDLKIALQPLQAPQALNLLDDWCRRLELKPPPDLVAARLCQLQNCTPGDFANVARQHRLQPFSDGSSLLTAVERECSYKDGCGSRRMGF
jgi:transitional endoplasmic reticulum ATPase